ncbi:hypothetical protein COCHEDRAFT_1154450 [Bipolaris maydis C5]|uniref:alcohol dehydrogenase n=1 Tax=Cochliobolus heterostrophus (strain C5 / ATCC 48332 / race O) TaxID=701091 RepID=M2T564_COCH5|nr:hypothetical protein COCHEDRAFT_1154450 [Bipolaris maydis C5]
MNDVALLFNSITLLYNEWPSGVGEAANGICGHEGAGTVVAVGSNVKDFWQIGNRAGIKWVTSICHRCEFCTNGQDECACPKQQNSGQYCVTDGRYATKIPDGVKDEEAGPIMCGGVTAYVACKRSNVRPGQWVVIPGAGGGLGHFGIQYAKHMGMRVIAIDGGDTKRDLYFTTCADITSKVLKTTQYGAHGILVFPSTNAAYESAPHLLRPGGTMVCMGIPKNTNFVVGATPALLCVKKLNVVGSITGTLKEVEEALDFTARGLVHPVLTYGGLEDLDRLCADMRAGKLVGRAVIKVAS